MSIYDDPAPWFNSGFEETGTYHPYGAADIPNLTVIIDWGEQTKSSFKNSQIDSVTRKNTVEFYKSGVATINEKKDAITVVNVKGARERFIVKEIVYQDQYIWRVAI